jgi:predicted metal-dependent hydrolase
MTLNVRPGSTLQKRHEVVEEWHRDLIREALPELIAKWEWILGVKVKGCTVRKMKTRWGSCTPRTGCIRINTDLAKKPAECLEYIVIHEMAHLLEPTHNKRFVALMDQFVPKWKLYKAELNRLPVRHEDWVY